MLTNTDIFEHIKSPNFSCEKCCYITNNKKDYKKHLLTSKHIKTYNGKIQSYSMCECGKKCIKTASNLKSWRANSCGCWHNKSRLIHWWAWTRLYQIYRWALRRCYDIKCKSYSQYWWRWLTCERKEFIDFKNDIPALLKNNRNLAIKIGDNEFTIYLSKLNIKPEQYYIIKNEGISKIKNDVYDVSEKADIIIKINII
jgi:hypothetical protein